MNNNLKQYMKQMETARKNYCSIIENFENFKSTIDSSRLIDTYQPDINTANTIIENLKIHNPYLTT